MEDKNLQQIIKSQKESFDMINRAMGLPTMDEMLDKGLVTDKEKERINYYARTHSNCCDSLILNGICMSCKEPTISQSEEIK